MKKIILLILLCLLCGCSQYSYTPKAKDESLKIVVLSDPHYISPSLIGDSFYTEQEFSDGKMSIYIDELMDGFVDQMKKEKPDLIVITGDLTYNGEKASHVDLTKKLKTLKKDGIQTLVIPGNHDLLNVHSTDYSKDVLYNSPFVNVEGYLEIYEEFGYQDCLSKDENSLSYIYKASDSLWLLLLDSNTYEKNSSFAPSSDGYLKKETIAWLDEELSSKPEDVNLVAFMHHPLLDHAGASDYIIKNPNMVFELFNKYNIFLSFSGHVHVQNVKEKDNHTNVSISSLAVYDHQYTLFEYVPNEEIDIKTVNVDMQTYAKEHSLKDPFFEDFETNSYEYFKKYSTTRLVGAYVGEDIPVDLSNELFELKGIANAYQFKGEGYKFKEILENHQRYEEILLYKNSYAASLFKMLNYNKIDANSLKIKLN